MVANRKHTSEVLAEQIASVLPEVQVRHASLERGLGMLGGDLIVSSTPAVTSRLAGLLAPATPVVTVVRTLRRDAWEQVMALPPRTRALVVNDGADTAVDTVAMLHELGAIHLELQAIYPGLEPVPRIGLAITPGEPHLVPSWVERVLNLGDRVIDPSSYLDMLTVLGRLDAESYRRVASYGETVMLRPGTAQTIRWLAELKGQLEGVLDAVHDGIVAYDERGIVTLANRAAEALLGKPAWKLVGKSIDRAWSETGLRGAGEAPSATRPSTPGPSGVAGPGAPAGVLDIAGRQVVVRRAALPGGGEIVAFRDVTELHELERRLRQDLRNRGHVARYTFEDFVGESPPVLNLLAKARRLSRCNGSVLIFGESGTGKEVVAQAIHNGSPRRKHPFVALNCAAIPEQLLESELFGYEDGAFTGARRGGKEGLFEQAHLGTIFLDEIGDLSPALQARLLRVLEEREVMRVGATRLRPIDVRVICATNRDLAALVRAGRFRADLYYRLNVLTLSIPPLRERKEDIAALADHFLAQLGDRRRLSPAVIAALMRHDWPGNVRELRNCIEYLVSAVDGEFQPDDLPGDVRRPPGHALRTLPGGPAVKAEPSSRPAAIGGDGARLAVLARVAEAARRGRGIGRREIARALVAVGYPITEHQVRLHLAELARRDWIRLRRGRAGCSLTELGEAELARAGILAAH